MPLQRVPIGGVPRAVAERNYEEEANDEQSDPDEDLEAALLRLEPNLPGAARSSTSVKV